MLEHPVPRVTLERLHPVANDVESCVYLAAIFSDYFDSVQGTLCVNELYRELLRILGIKVCGGSFFEKLKRDLFLFLLLIALSVGTNWSEEFESFLSGQ